MDFKTLLICLMILASLTSYSQKLTKSELEGIWLRPCQNGKIQIQIFENDINYANEIFFEDVECTDPKFSFLEDGVFKLENSHIDYQFKKVELVLYSAELIEDYNRRQVCGKNNWKPNSPMEITGFKCALFQENKLVQVPKEGDLRFGIWKTEDKKLFFGLLTQKENALTPETRPTRFDEFPYYLQK